MMAEVPPIVFGRLPALSYVVLLGAVLAYIGIEQIVSTSTRVAQNANDWLQEWWEHIAHGPEHVEARIRILVTVHLEGFPKDVQQSVIDTVLRTGGFTVDGVSYKIDESGLPVEIPGPPDPRYPDLSSGGHIPEQATPEPAPVEQPTPPVVAEVRVEPAVPRVDDAADVRTAELNIEQIADHTKGVATPEQLKHLKDYLQSLGIHVSDAEALEIFKQGHYTKGGESYTLWINKIDDRPLTTDSYTLPQFFSTPRG